MRKAGFAAIGLGLTLAMAACGGSNPSADAPPAPTAPPAAQPTKALPPTPDPNVSYRQYLAWRGGMVQVVGKIKRVYSALTGMVEALPTTEITGDTGYMEGHLQDARDQINDAQDQYDALTPTRSYRSIHWVMGQAIQSYAHGINHIDAGLVNSDIESVRTGVREIKQGERDLAAINALNNEHQWLLWLAKKGEERHQNESST